MERWTQLLCNCLVLSFCIDFIDCFEGCLVRYARRGCYDQVYEGVLVTCDGEGQMRSMPDIQIDEKNLVYLQFKNFRFPNLTRADLSRFRSVRCLSIMHSGIHHVTSDAFADLEALNELELIKTDLSGAGLGFLFHPQFRAKVVTVSHSPHVSGLRMHADPLSEQTIRVLNLGHNGLAHLPGSLFEAKELEPLEELVVTNNRLRHLDWASLGKLKALNKLHINNNKLQTIPATMEDTFFAVKDLNLGGNPFHCNCKLRWMKTFLDQTNDKFLDYKQVTCASPGKPRTMDDTPLSRFACSTPTKPVVTWYKLDDQKYVVNCTSEGDPAPKLKMWLPGDKKLITPPSDNLSRLRTVTPSVVTAAGGVRCQATNSEGSDESLEALPTTTSGGSRPTSKLAALMVAMVITYTVDQDRKSVV